MEDGDGGDGDGASSCKEPQRSPRAEEWGEAHLLCKCLLEPGVDSGKLLNYFKQRTKVLSLPLLTWILVKTNQTRNLSVNHLTMISARLSWQERGGRAYAGAWK